MLGFGFPIKIIKRPERLIIMDYRPTWVMLGALAGLVFCLVVFVGSLIGVDLAFDAFGMWAALGLAGVCLVLSFRGTVREVYHFDKTANSYAFIRQYIYKKEVIEGGLGQFRGVRVHTEVSYDSDNHRTERHVVSLLQDGPTFGGSADQPIREVSPLLNFYSTELRIASAIASFLDIKLVESHD